MARPYHIYTAESSVSNFPNVIRSMFIGLIQARYVAYRIFIKDVKAEYSRSKFGILWDFLDPLILGIIFYFLKKGGVFDIEGINIPYSVFIIYGLLIFQTFSESVTFPLDIMQRSRSMITHLKISPESLLLAVVYRIVFNSFFRIIVMVIFSLVTGWFSVRGFLLFLLLYPSILLAGMSIGVLLAPFNTIYNDVGRVTKMLLTPLRYASPVLYPIPNVVPFSYLHDVNPIALIISDLRSLATENVFSDVHGYVLRLCIFFAISLVAWFIFHISISVLAEHT